MQSEEAEGTPIQHEFGGHDGKHVLFLPPGKHNKFARYTRGKSSYLVVDGMLCIKKRLEYCTISQTQCLGPKNIKYRVIIVKKTFEEVCNNPYEFLKGCAVPFHTSADKAVLEALRTKAKPAGLASFGFNKPDLQKLILKTYPQLRDMPIPTGKTIKKRSLEEIDNAETNRKRPRTPLPPKFVQTENDPDFENIHDNFVDNEVYEDSFAAVAKRCSEQIGLLDQTALNTTAWSPIVLDQTDPLQMALEEQYFQYEF